METIKPLPPYASARAALRRALPALTPPELISVTDAAEKYMRVYTGGQWQPYRRADAPYMVEPQDTTVSRDYAATVFCGPSQSGKTLMLQAASVHAVCSQPSRVALFQMTREAAAEFERNKWSPMVRNSPDVAKRRDAGRGADNQYSKRFIGGTELTFDWPTATKLASFTGRLVMGTDFDRWADSIDGEGSGYVMMRARTRTLRSRGSVVIESSPGRAITDESWRAKTPHDAPPVAGGVLSLYPAGTRGRWYWPCPECGAFFEPTFARLRWAESNDPAECGATAQMICPHCREGFGHELKGELNTAGRWLHEAANGRELVRLGDPAIRRTDMASYWLDGAAASFATWAEIVGLWVTAVAAFDRTGDEEQLKTVTNTAIGRPYLPRHAGADGELSVQALRDKAAGNSTPQGTAPSWTAYLTVSVDVQGGRFVVGVTAWGLDGRHQPIDRFDLVNPPEGAPGGASRGIRPFDIAEDWAVLDGLATRSWPVDGAHWVLRPVALAVDMHGGGSTTEHAYRFYRGRRKEGQGKLWFLTRGEGGEHRDRVWLRAPERSANKRRRAASDVEILHMATDRLKDAVASSLRLTEPGRNWCGLPEWFGEAETAEFTAERRGPKGWVKKPGMQRNESLDHLVQARALHIQIKGETITEGSPPFWARLDADNPFADWVGPRAAVEAPKPTPAAPPRAAWIAPRKGKWL
ncbi:phage terminase large subunit family protein [Pararhodobacter zhoushanensis]|uniref:Phage terminase large subunit family protein n=1 Tax=Pararhodobacter zhoushanensis TaxID=2479545 RepID=A0ABT3H4B9_9RHOB|nr:phage terminase large subunit family protein [Pararhodobacter zhoushanensis]MCW1934545.1 phage terminase large subunit family protein [Pararhodobacter zhoushanensis]